MKSKILTLCAVFSLLFSTSHAQITFFFGDDVEEPLDQFLVTAGFMGSVLWQAIDLAKENHFQYLKILSAEFVYGSQEGGFSCPLKEGETGTILSYEDKMMKFTMVCSGVQPDDPDYIDVEVYKELFEFLMDEDEDDDLSFDDEDDESAF